MIQNEQGDSYESMPVNKGAQKIHEPKFASVKSQSVQNT